MQPSTQMGTEATLIHPGSSHRTGWDSFASIALDSLGSTRIRKDRGLPSLVKKRRKKMRKKKHKKLLKATRWQRRQK
jgi:mRNA-processing protein COX24